VVTVTDITIKSNALRKIGAAAISSDTDGTNEASVAADLYPIIKESALSNYDWNFATTTFSLNRDVAAPTNTAYDYSFQLPTDTLQVLYITNTSGVSISDWEIANDKILTNTSAILAVYIRDMSEVDFPSFFTDMLIARCAFEFAEPVVGIGTVRDRAEREYVNKLAQAQRKPLKQSCLEQRHMRRRPGPQRCRYSVPHHQQQFEQ